ncbi:MAG: DUF2254 domain-containing protein [Microbacteriaceae bacterium]
MTTPNTGNRIRTTAARITEAVESRLWPLPVAAILAALFLGSALTSIDLAVDSSLPDAVDSLVFNGGAETARSVLSSIAGSLITATSLTFSLTVVALQLASSQASPRVLRLFARDRRVHGTLAVFLGTFAYAITVLRSIRDATDTVSEFVPRISVTLGFILTLASVIVLVFFLSHLATQLRVETILKSIHSETDRAIDLVADGAEHCSAYTADVDPPANRRAVLSSRSGFITSRDRSTLLSYASDHGLVIQEHRAVGDNVLAGTPLAYWWPRPGATVDVDHDEACHAIDRAHYVGYERTSAQDIGYGFQQIVDIGVRALSPGVNDPTTASHALGHLSALIDRTLAAATYPPALAGSDGELALVTVTRSPEIVIAGALSGIRHYGASDPAVGSRFLQVIADVAYTNPRADVHGALARQVDALEQQLDTETADPVAVGQVKDELKSVRSALFGFMQ